MSRTFVSEWESWKPSAIPQTPRRGTDKTDKSPSGPSRGPFQELEIPVPARIERLRPRKPDTVAMNRVKEILADGRRITGRELRQEIGLDPKALYAALGEMYDWHELATNPEGYYWLVPEN